MIIHTHRSIISCQIVIMLYIHRLLSWTDSYTSSILYVQLSSSSLSPIHTIPPLCVQADLSFKLAASSAHNSLLNPISIIQFSEPTLYLSFVVIHTTLPLLVVFNLDSSLTVCLVCSNVAGLWPGSEGCVCCLATNPRLIGWLVDWFDWLIGHLAACSILFLVLLAPEVLPSPVVRDNSWAVAGRYVCCIATW